MPRYLQKTIFWVLAKSSVFGQKSIMIFILDFWDPVWNSMSLCKCYHVANFFSHIINKAKMQLVQLIYQIYKHIIIKWVMRLWEACMLIYFFWLSFIIIKIINSELNECAISFKTFSIII
jgi:hypothetical protein